MDQKIIMAGALAGLMVAGAAGGAVFAQTAGTGDGAGMGLTQEQAIEIALLEIPGQVTEVEFEIEEGVRLYEIEIVDAAGQEFEVEIAAETGSILEIEAEDDDHDDD